MRLAGAGGRALFSSRSLWATVAQKMEAFGRGLLAYFNAREKTQEREEEFRPFLQVTWSGWHWGREKTNAASSPPWTNSVSLKLVPPCE